MKKNSTIRRRYQEAVRALRHPKAKEFTQREKDMLYGAYMALDWVLEGAWTPRAWLDKWEPRP